MWRAVVLCSLAACGAAPSQPVDAGVDMHVEDAGACDTWAGWGHVFFSNTCNGCHGFTHDDVRAQSARMTEEISSGRMPQTGPLNEPEFSRVLEYLACGAP